MGTKKMETSADVRRRRFMDELKDEAVQMLLDGHSVDSVTTLPGLPGANQLYR